MRRLVSAFLTVLMLANIAIGSTAVLAEVLEHEQEAIQLDDKNAPAEQSGTHCNHGCAGHYGHHFQFQASSHSYQSAADVSASVIPAAAVLIPKFIPALPFRPPPSA